jgi:hypothetical protein
LFLGNGTLSPAVRAKLESEGLVLVEEGLPGSVRYRHFKAPGRRFHGKVTAVRVGLGISEERIAIYCRSGRSKLVDTLFSEPRLSAVEFALEGTDEVSIRIDFDRGVVPKVSGQMEIRFSSPNALSIVEELRTRAGRDG